MKVSLCMIARDEAQCIGAALTSVKGLVDEMIVVDTGSVDDTGAIAKAHGAKVINTLWQKDFAYHRNQALVQATGDWIMILDCDEVVEPMDCQEIRRILEQSEHRIIGYNMTIVNCIGGKGLAQFDALRLVRRFKTLRFQNPIHEQVIESIREYDPDATIGRLPLSIWHHGYDPGRSDQMQKHKRNLEILQGIGEKDGYLYAMLGDEYLKMGKLEEAAEAYTLSWHDVDKLGEGYTLSLVLNYISTLINLGRYEQAWGMLQEAKSQQPYFKDLYFLEFWMLQGYRQNKAALEALDWYQKLTSGAVKNGFGIKHFELVYDLDHIVKVLENKA